MDFVIAGVAKSGTSAVAEAMARSPHIFFPFRKDSHVFAPEIAGMAGGPGDAGIAKSVQWAADRRGAWKATSGDGRLVGDVGAFYLYSDAALERIAAGLTSRGKVVVVLRHPVRRAYSAYLHLVRDGREVNPFSVALDLEADRIARGYEPLWWLVEGGRYVDRLARLEHLVGRERLVILTHEELEDSPREVMLELSEVLELPMPLSPKLERVNQSGIPRSRVLQKFLSDQNLLKTLGGGMLPRTAWLKLRAKVQEANLRHPELPTPDMLRLNRIFEPEFEGLKSAWGIEYLPIEV